MSLFNKLAHLILKVLCKKKYTVFRKKSKCLEKTQKEILFSLLSADFLDKPVSNLHDFRSQLPIIGYQNIADKIILNRETRTGLTKKKVKYYQPTSGSTMKEKWIPYTEDFLKELNFASLPWIYDLYKNYPKINKGKHYWSLSWLPEDFRENVENDDLEVVSFAQRQVLKQIMAMPWDVSKMKTSFDSQLATVIALVACEDLTLISIWSPTFIISQLKFIMNHLDMIKDVFVNQEWPDNTSLNQYEIPRISNRNLEIIKNIEGHELRQLVGLWPALNLISCWDSSTSKKWAQELSEIFVGINIQGKGLWATEAVVTIPFKGKYPLSFCSHFYEFKSLEDNNLYYSWELKEGMRVSPVVTTGSGFYRYEIEDRLIVTSFYNQVPCFEFIGRIKDIDLVGEKISHELAENIVNCISTEFNIEALCLIANSSLPLPKYEMIMKVKESKEILQEICLRFENLLCANYHYKLARELGQLDSADVRMTHNPWELYKSLRMKEAKIEGNIKPEPIILI